MCNKNHDIIYKISKMALILLGISLFATTLTESLTSCTSLSSNNPKECSALWAQKKYADYINECGKSANEDPNVGYNFAYAYFWGLTGETNYLKAKSYYTLSAKLGNMYAQYDLGLMYLFGQGVTKDPEHAFWWIERSAEQGYPMAQKTLIQMYINGIGITRNQQKAQEWQDKGFGINNNNFQTPNSTENSDLDGEIGAEKLYFDIRNNAQMYLTFPSSW